MDPEKRREFAGMSIVSAGGILSNSHNQKCDSSSFDIGDHIKRPIDGSLIGTLYNHHGIYLGGGMVIDFLDCGVRIVKLDEFSEGKTCRKVSSKRKFSRTHVCLRAFSFFIGENDFGDYNSVINNCEHFVNLCVTGNRISKQVETTIDIAELLARWTIAVGGLLLDD